MTDYHIQKSKQLLKDLEKEIASMRELMRQVDVTAFNMKGIWIAISVTHENWRRNTENH